MLGGTDIAFLGNAFGTSAKLLGGLGGFFLTHLGKREILWNVQRKRNSLEDASITSPSFQEYLLEKCDQRRLAS